MAFVSVPKDLNKVKTKLAMNLTKRQLICFSAAGAIGIPVYFFSKGIIGNSAAVLLMIALMFPFFFIAMYERDGRPAEKIICNMIRVRLLWPGKRPYKTENFYKQLIDNSEQITGKGGKAFNEKSKKSKTTAKASANQKAAAKPKTKK